MSEELTKQEKNNKELWDKVLAHAAVVTKATGGVYTHLRAIAEQYTEVGLETFNTDLDENMVRFKKDHGENPDNSTLRSSLSIIRTALQYGVPVTDEEGEYLSKAKQQVANREAKFRVLGKTTSIPKIVNKLAIPEEVLETEPVEMTDKDMLTEIAILVNSLQQSQEKNKAEKNIILMMQLISKKLTDLVADNESTGS